MRGREGVSREEKNHAENLVFTVCRVGRPAFGGLPSRLVLEAPPGPGVIPPMELGETAPAASGHGPECGKMGWIVSLI